MSGSGGRRGRDSGRPRQPLSPSRPNISAGIITLPPHPRFLDAHHKSFPLILKQEELEDWLNPRIEHRAFEALFGLTDVRVEIEARAVNDGDFSALDTELLVLKPVA